MEYKIHQAKKSGNLNQAIAEILEDFPEHEALVRKLAREDQQPCKICKEVHNAN